MSDFDREGMMNWLNIDIHDEKLPTDIVGVRRTSVCRTGQRRIAMRLWTIVNRLSTKKGVAYQKTTPTIKL